MDGDKTMGDRRILKGNKIYDIGKSTEVLKFGKLTPGIWLDENTSVESITIYKSVKGNYFSINRCLSSIDVHDLTEEEVIEIIKKRQKIEVLKKHFPHEYSRLEEV